MHSFVTTRSSAQPPLGIDHPRTPARFPEHRGLRCSMHQPADDPSNTWISTFSHSIGLQPATATEAPQPDDETRQPSSPSQVVCLVLCPAMLLCAQWVVTCDMTSTLVEAQLARFLVVASANRSRLVCIPLGVDPRPLHPTDTSTAPFFACCNETEPLRR